MKRSNKVSLLFREHFCRYIKVLIKQRRACRHSTLYSNLKAKGKEMITEPLYTQTGDDRQSQTDSMPKGVEELTEGWLPHIL